MKKHLSIALALMLTFMLTTSVFATTKKLSTKPISLESAANIFNNYLSENFKTQFNENLLDYNEKPITEKITYKKIIMLNNYPVLLFNYLGTNPSDDSTWKSTAYICNIENGKVMILLKETTGEQLWTGHANIGMVYDKINSKIVFDFYSHQGESCFSENNIYYNFTNNKLSKILSSERDYTPKKWEYMLNNKTVTKKSYDTKLANYIAVPSNPKGLDSYESYLKKFLGNDSDGKYATLNYRNVDGKYASLVDLDGDGKNELVGATEKHLTYPNYEDYTLSLTFYNVKYPNSSYTKKWDYNLNADKNIYLSDKNYIVVVYGQGDGSTYEIFKYTSGKLNPIDSFWNEYGDYDNIIYHRNNEEITKSQWDNAYKEYGIDKVKTNLYGTKVENNNELIYYAPPSNY